MKIEWTLNGNSLITPAELAERLHVSRKTLSRWEKAGYLPAPIRIGKRVIRWRLEDIIRFVGHSEPAKKDENVVVQPTEQGTFRAENALEQPIDEGFVAP